MLRTPKALGKVREGEALSQKQPALLAKRDGSAGQTKRNYGRLARSDEHSPSVAVSGRESGHAVQVRRRTEDSCIQAGQPLALQKVEARPVDGRDVHGNGTGGEAKAESGRERRRTELRQTSRAAKPAPHKRWAHVWTWIEVDCWAGCRLLEHQGGGAEEEGWAD